MHLALLTVAYQGWLAFGLALAALPEAVDLIWFCLA